ncbi:MAG: diguanylate cyclase [Desulfatibacillum sp.]|nr:diguanylate cyclase [Desulfatibacillum sp.]
MENQQIPLGSVLIVDDDEPAREALYEMVLTTGYKAAFASDATSALEILRSHPIEVVLTDIQMPDMDGLELTAIIKQKFGADVIVITGFADSHTYDEAIGRGASDFILKPVRLPELKARIQRVFRERKLWKERDALLEQLKKLSITDGLTNLYNRRHFYRQLAMEANRAERYARVLSLLFFDIDSFKRFNDTYGHLAGDEALKSISRATETCLRIADSIFRYGGEEFSVILPETSGEQAMIAAHRLRNDIDQLRLSVGDGETARVTVSIGVTEFSPGEEMESCVKRADQAMYIAKRSGGNQVHFILPES